MNLFSKFKWGYYYGLFGVVAVLGVLLWWVALWLVTSSGGGSGGSGGGLAGGVVSAGSGEFGVVSATVREGDTGVIVLGDGTEVEYVWELGRRGLERQIDADLYDLEKVVEARALILLGHEDSPYNEDVSLLLVEHVSRSYRVEYTKGEDIMYLMFDDISGVLWKVSCADRVFSPKEKEYWQDLGNSSIEDEGRFTSIIFT